MFCEIGDSMSEERKSVDRPWRRRVCWALLACILVLSGIFAGVWWRRPDQPRLLPADAANHSRKLTATPAPTEVAEPLPGKKAHIPGSLLSDALSALKDAGSAGDAARILEQLQPAWRRCRDRKPWR